MESDNASTGTHMRSLAESPRALLETLVEGFVQWQHF
jgi:hypothetical protein